jgi:hypothetical protein
MSWSPEDDLDEHGRTSRQVRATTRELSVLLQRRSRTARHHLSVLQRRRLRQDRPETSPDTRPLRNLRGNLMTNPIHTLTEALRAAGATRLVAQMRPAYDRVIVEWARRTFGGGCG